MRGIFATTVFDFLVQFTRVIFMLGPGAPMAVALRPLNVYLCNLILLGTLVPPNNHIWGSFEADEVMS